MIRALRCMSPKTPLGRLRSGGALCIFRSCRMAVKRRICGRFSVFCDRIFTVFLVIRRKNRRCFRVDFAVLCCGFRLLLLFRRLRGIAEINIFTDGFRHDLDVFSLQNLIHFCVKIDAFLLRICTHRFNFFGVECTREHAVHNLFLHKKHLKIFKIFARRVPLARGY